MNGFCNSEVSDYPGFVREKNVLRFDVAMYYTVIVRICECACDVLENWNGFGDWNAGISLESLAKGESIDKRHRVIRKTCRDSRRENRNDIRMLQLRRELDLSLESFGAYSCGELGHQQFHRD